MAAFVLGNGVSRRPIDVNLLMKRGSVYGCNALYRTHAVTALIATDKPIAEEIQNSGYAKENKFYTRRPLPGMGAHAVPQKYFGFSSGPIAAGVAAQDQHNPIYLLGFDLGPTLLGTFNNVYADTEFYKQTNALPTFTGNWVKQLITVMRDHPGQTFIRVYGETTAEIAEFDSLENFQKMLLGDFAARINKPKDL